MTVVPGNTPDIEGLGVPVLNPFDADAQDGRDPYSALKTLKAEMDTDAVQLWRRP